MADSVADQVAKLEAARHLVLSDATHYAAIVPGILRIIGGHSHLEIRRWGAEFLAETFASPSLSIQGKEGLSLQVLQTLKELLEAPGDDVAVLKYGIQTAASLYGLVFKHIIYNPKDSATWEQMAAVKSNILKRWDTAIIGVRVCCIKFVQRVVQVQTEGVISDPRRPDQGEISLILVPRDHPLIPIPKLEAEASGLLDRFLNVFYEDDSDAVLVNATLNCLTTLVRSRPMIANKIVTAVLNFNPLKPAKGVMSPKTMIQVKSMERTARAFLMNLYRRNENSPLAPRIKQYIELMALSRLDLFDATSRKRGASGEPSDNPDSSKRVRLGSDLGSRTVFPPLPSGPITLTQLYTLTIEESLRQFDVTVIPIDLLAQITLPILQHIDHAQLHIAIDAIRSRITTLQATPLPPPQEPVLLPVALAFEDDDEEYEPDFEPTEDAEQLLNKADMLPSEEPRKPTADLALGPFTLAQPPPLTLEQAEQLGKDTIDRVFGMMNRIEEPSKAPKPGLNRLAGSNYDKEAWITIMTRLATRASAGLGSGSDNVKDEEQPNGTIVKAQPVHNLADGIREQLWQHVVEDFRNRIPVAIAWLNEEWYNDRLTHRLHANDDDDHSSAKPNYDRWVLRVLDAIIPYLDARDKVLIRFLSEIPSIDESLLARVTDIARDPDRVTLAINAIHYLLLVRPPVHQLCIDALEDLWRTHDDARAPARKLLAKFAPHVLETEVKEDPSADDVPQQPIKKEPTAPAPTPAPIMLFSEKAPSPPKLEIPFDPVAAAV